MVPQLQAAILELEKIKHLFDFTTDDFGHDLLDICADRNRETFQAETTPTGESWPPLSDKYDRWKSRYFPGKNMGHLHEILSLEINFHGVRTVTADRAESRFGASEEAYVEGQWFQFGDPAHNRPERRWHGVDEIAAQLCDDRVHAQARKVS
jgi:hypothetical protein